MSSVTWKVWIVLAHACFMWQYFISLSKSTVTSKPAALLMVKDLLFPKVTSVTSCYQNKELFCMFSNMHTVEIFYFGVEHKIACMSKIIKNLQRLKTYTWAQTEYTHTQILINLKPNLNLTLWRTVCIVWLILKSIYFTSCTDYVSLCMLFAKSLFFLTARKE